jgi:hypothetical protein
MSANHLRKDPTCLNCGSEVTERYCTHCGQENIEPHETFGHLVSHFFQDITHYDSKAWITIRDLLFRPGLLTKLYLSGKRQSFVNPIRMYVFVSFVFFLLLAYIGPHHDPYEVHRPGVHDGIEVYNAALDSVNTSNRLGNGQIVSLTDSQYVHIMKTTIGAPEEAVQRYDSLVKTRPVEKRGTGMDRFFERSILYLQGKYGANMGRAIMDKFQHSIPKLMFVFLPLFALFLKVAYRRRKLVYADHAIFTIHLHTFLFLLGMVAFLLDYWMHSSRFTLIAIFIAILYFVLALKNVYGQSIGQSILKAVMVMFLYGFSILLIIIGYLLSILAFV